MRGAPWSARLSSPLLRRRLLCLSFLGEGARSRCEGRERTGRAEPTGETWTIAVVGGAGQPRRGACCCGELPPSLLARTPPATASLLRAASVYSAALSRRAQRIRGAGQARSVEAGATPRMPVVSRTPTESHQASGESPASRSLARCPAPSPLKVIKFEPLCPMLDRHGRPSSAFPFIDKMNASVQLSAIRSALKTATRASQVVGTIQGKAKSHAFEWMSYRTCP